MNTSGNSYVHNPVAICKQQPEREMDPSFSDAIPPLSNLEHNELYFWVKPQTTNEKGNGIGNGTGTGNGNGKLMKKWYVGIGEGFFEH